MKQLLNTLYVTTPNSYLSLDGGNIVLNIDRQKVAKLPLINFQNIVTFGYAGVSPALIHYCLTNQIGLAFVSEFGQFLGRITGETNGNVVLRHRQFVVSTDPTQAVQIASACLLGKTYNQRWVLQRAKRDHALVVDVERISAVSDTLKDSYRQLSSAKDLDTLRGIEGKLAEQYFSVFDELILQQRNDFTFNGRNRRPPMDRVNALLSFAYTLLASDYASAIEAVGLDSYVGFLHQDRSGRNSLALDLMEELRSVFADRFVLMLINKRVIGKKDFDMQEDGAVYLNKAGKQKFIQAWQERKSETLQHPFLNEKIKWGLVPYAQAMLLARYLRGDLDAYPPFMWK